MLEQICQHHRGRQENFVLKAWTQNALQVRNTPRCNFTCGTRGLQLEAASRVTAVRFRRASRGWRACKIYNASLAAFMSASERDNACMQHSWVCVLCTRQQLVSGAGIERNNRLGVVLSYGDAGKRISARVLRKRCARIIWPPEKKRGRWYQIDPKFYIKLATSAFSQNACSASVLSLFDKSRAHMQL